MWRKRWYRTRIVASAATIVILTTSVVNSNWLAVRNIYGKRQTVHGKRYQANGASDRLS